MHPNFVTGILGALALVLAFIGFGSLPLNVAGLLLIGLGVVLFVLEFHVTSHGLLTVGGHRVLRAGRLRALHGSPDPTAPDDRGSTRGRSSCVTGAHRRVMAFVLFIVVRRRRRQQLAGPAAPVARRSRTVHDRRRSARTLAPMGSSTRPARSGPRGPATSAPLARGTPVRVVGQDGLT